MSFAGGCAPTSRSTLAYQKLVGLLASRSNGKGEESWRSHPNLDCAIALFSQFMHSSGNA